MCFLKVVSLQLDSEKEEKCDIYDVNNITYSIRA